MRLVIYMKSIAAFLLLVPGLWVRAADSGVTNLVVTPLEVDPGSVRLTATETRYPNLTFNFLHKTPEQVRAILPDFQRGDPQVAEEVT